MSVISLDIDDHVIGLLESDGRSAKDTATELIVMDLHRRGRLSRGQAAELLRMQLLDVIQRASNLGIPFFNLTPDELDEEFAAAREIGPRPS